jgi:hypothetical protein
MSRSLVKKIPLCQSAKFVVDERHQFVCGLVVPDHRVLHDASQSLLKETGAK